VVEEPTTAGHAMTMQQSPHDSPHPLEIPVASLGFPPSLSHLLGGPAAPAWRKGSGKS